MLSSSKVSSRGVRCGTLVKLVFSPALPVFVKCIPKQKYIPVDGDGNTAGDVSLSLNDEESYRAIRDAGIRSGVCVFFTCPTC